MKITKEAYAVLKPAARSYWIAMNESTRNNNPATYKLRETLLQRNTTLSNLTLIEMMLQEDMWDRYGKYRDNNNTNINDIKNTVTDVTDDMKKGLCGATQTMLEEWHQQGKLQKLVDKEYELRKTIDEKILGKLHHWIKKASHKVAMCFKRLIQWAKDHPFAAVYITVIILVAILAVLSLKFQGPEHEEERSRIFYVINILIGLGTTAAALQFILYITKKYST